MAHLDTGLRKRVVWRILGAVIAVGGGSALLLMTPGTRVRAATDETVKVVNTASSAIPIVVQGTPTFVALNNPGVPLLVGDVDNPRRHGYQASQNILTDVVSGTAFFTVPAGHLAVIEHVSLSGFFDSGAATQAFVRCTNLTQPNTFGFGNGQEVNHALALTAEGDVNGLTGYAASQPISCIASEGDGNNPTLSVHVQTSKLNESQHTWVMAVSGYLITP